MKISTCCAALIILAISILLPAPQAEAVVRIGMELPSGQFQDLRGNSVRLPDKTRGKVTVILFWALGCSSCREDLPAIDAVYRKFRAKGVEVLAINLGQLKGDVDKFAKEAGISYTMLLDLDKKSTQLYDVQGIPRTIILDRKGTIRFKIIGSTPPGLIRKYVQSLLDS